MAEIGQVLANLSVGKAEQLAELVRVGRVVAVANEMVDLAEVQTESVDHSLGDRAFTGCFAFFRSVVHTRRAKFAEGVRRWGKPFAAGRQTILI